jgi:hypothetical protein
MPLTPVQFHVEIHINEANDVTYTLSRQQTGETPSRKSAECALYSMPPLLRLTYKQFVDFFPQGRFNGFLAKYFDKHSVCILTCLIITGWAIFLIIRDIFKSTYKIERAHLKSIKASWDGNKIHRYLWHRRMC